MKKTLRIREEIAKLQDVLKAAETRDAERIGRIALKAGLGDFEIEDSILQSAFEEIAHRFQSMTVEGRRHEQPGLRQAPGSRASANAGSNASSHASSHASAHASFHASSGAERPSAGTSPQVPTDTAESQTGEA